jgi:DNA-3-methyladenine glycosylase
MKLTKEFYTRDSVKMIARDLLGKAIVTSFDKKLTAGIISETEAYAGIIDRASHAYNNRRTSRTEVMFSIGGVAYVYLCYGMHHLFNIVTNQKDTPDAVLLRGILPITGIDVMEKRTRKKSFDRSFTNGPGKASKALGINVSHSGESLSGNKIWIEDMGIEINDNDYTTGPRIGVGYAGKDAFLPYRFLLIDEAVGRIKKKKPSNTLSFFKIRSGYYLTVPVNSLPALNLTTFLAAILISLPV